MTVGQQLHNFGIAVVAIDGHVLILDKPLGVTDNCRARMTPKQAQRFAAQLAGAYIQAAGGVHWGAGGHSIVIGEAR